jgi:hypothetical protein
MTPSQQLYAIIREISDLLHELHHQEKPFRRGEVCVKLQEIGGQLCDVRAALDASDARVFENRTRPALTLGTADAIPEEGDGVFGAAIIKAAKGLGD